MSTAPTILLTGGTGFPGSDLARRFMADGYRTAVITRQPYFDRRQYRISGAFGNTDTVMNNTFWVGVYPGLTEPMLDYVADRLETFFGVNF